MINIIDKVKGEETNKLEALQIAKLIKEKVENKLRETTDYVSFEINYIVDESLIGGMVIRIGDRVVDSSIKTKIDEIAKNLRKIQLA